ncbi:serine/threonine protein kinase RIO2, putative [Plasmodium knowlesi strain H]|uniref:Serine/threonine-protein kinase RIO2 n=3 Tax=Plasmodium knowlesi TaxID=5850 RepID=A0A5K1V8V3_PLAKH|nr:serine/threonine protein kinase RIO2, putative [Plasmodium knowlesi strain H]OTN68148.1 putative ROI kinase-like protein [Plasmodium knowlesi]CAA9987014.1 serine/threonine protein kinase RIO2, putative [Plasmodium knowlesi strain H]SBO26679.1 serine/threonine protein kinase RIO2, putative [Plasmodium knowlesi strain H]SBO28219.1 serine/threonine protein kinase RIO2, putative [Plasmodium knowlesi strain H]VVS76488.1 serine/threonine protein kinase RIO2, putative [Plasmodium knowlesi strain H|eukprot:XP_002258259.1 ROI kinase-like protein, putative [Plasmodium knowlesi strain H]
MKLDISCFCFLSKNEYRVLTAIEMGMRNHEYLPVSLIASIANLRKEGITSVLKKLLKNKLISHENKKYDGYKLTYLGYDFLALRAFINRGTLKSVGNQIGVGKESDIYICKDISGNLLCLKIHRLGRISFRTIKNNRDYYGKKNFRNWLYLSKIAATKEYAYLKALYENNFPVPKPYDLNRHMILMSYVNGYPLSHVKISNPFKIIDVLINTIIKFAKANIIHGDFNEFNILIDDDEKITVIDFPQIVSLQHANAKLYFDRDVRGVVNHFYKKYKIKIEDYPVYEDVILMSNDKIVVDENLISSSDEHALMGVLQNDGSDSICPGSEQPNCSGGTEQTEEMDEMDEMDEMGQMDQMDQSDEIDKSEDIDKSDESHGSRRSGEMHRSGANRQSTVSESTQGETPRSVGIQREDSFSSEGKYKDAYESNTEREKASDKFEKRSDGLDDNDMESAQGVVTDQLASIKGSLEEDTERRGGSSPMKDEESPTNGKCIHTEEKTQDEGKDHHDDTPGISEEEMERKIESSERKDEVGGGASEKSAHQVERTKGMSSEASSDEVSGDEESELTAYSSCDSEGCISENSTKKLSETWQPHIKKYTKEYAKSKLKYMYRKKKNKEKYKENLKTKNKKKLMEKIKNYV